VSYVKRVLGRGALNGALWELRLLNLNVIDIDLFVHFSWMFW
jgi:hypothetical protein